MLAFSLACYGASHNKIKPTELLEDVRHKRTRLPREREDYQLVAYGPGSRAATWSSDGLESTVVDVIARPRIHAGAGPRACLLTRGYPRPPSPLARRHRLGARTTVSRPRASPTSAQPQPAQVSPCRPQQKTSRTPPTRSSVGRSHHLLVSHRGVERQPMSHAFRYDWPLCQIRCVS